jgi:Zn-dependent alcohol dehydrogenase
VQVTGRTWRGSAFGGVKGRTELPSIVEGSNSVLLRRPVFLTTCLLDYLAGKIFVDEYVTHHRTLKEIQNGFDDMHVSSSIFQLAWPMLIADLRTHLARRVHPLRCGHVPGLSFLI